MFTTPDCARLALCRLDRPFARPGPQCSSVAAGLPVTRSAVSQHLKILRDAGLVSERAVGTRRIYRLNPTAVAALRDQLDAFWRRALEGYADVAGPPTEESS